MEIVIIYHSGFGHIRNVAEHFQKGASRELEQIDLISTLDAQDNSELLYQADAWISTI